MSAVNSSSHFKFFEDQKTKGGHHTSHQSGGMPWETFRSGPLRGCATHGSAGGSTPWSVASIGKPLQGRSSRGHIRTMCTPARTLCRTPILKGKTAAAGAHTALSMCVNALCLKFPLNDKSVCGWHKDLEVAGKR